jgi:YcxB-like protein
MKLNYILEREDHISFWKLHNSNALTKYIKYFFIFFFLFIAFLWIGKISLISDTVAEEGIKETLLRYLFPVLLFVGLWYFIFKRQSRISVTLVEKMTGKKLKDEMWYVEATDEHLLFSKPGSESKITWDTILKYTESPEWMLIYTGINTVIPIPKLKAAPAEDLPAFLELVRAKVPKK